MAHPAPHVRVRARARERTPRRPHLFVPSVSESCRTGWCSPCARSSALRLTSPAPWSCGGGGAGAGEGVLVLRSDRATVCHRLLPFALTGSPRCVSPRAARHPGAKERRPPGRRRASRPRPHLLRAGLAGLCPHLNQHVVRLQGGGVSSHSRDAFRSTTALLRGPASRIAEPAGPARHSPPLGAPTACQSGCGR